MPIYEYACPDCHCQFELMRPISKSAEAVACPECRKPSKRKLSAFSSVSRSAGGMTTPIAGAGGGCAGCSSSSCSTCGS